MEIFVDSLRIGVGDDYKVNKRVIKREWFHEILERDGFVREKYFLNLPYYQATIDDRGLKVQFSLPKVVKGDNVWGVGREYLKPVFRWVEKDLRDKGVKTSLLRGRVLRIDICRNVFTDYCFESYSEVLRSLYLKRTHRRDYIDGFLIGNTLRELCFYNKVKEVRENYGDDVILKYGLMGENLMRGEFRVLQKVDEVLKYPVLYAMELEKNYDLVPIVYLEQMEKVFDREFTGGRDVLVVSEERIRQALIDLSKYGRLAIEWYGLETFAYCNRDELKRVLLEHYTRQGVYKILKKIERQVEKFGDWRSKGFIDLYQELKTKFLDYKRDMWI